MSRLRTLIGITNKCLLAAPEVGIHPDLLYHLKCPHMPCDVCHGRRANALEIIEDITDVTNR